MQERRLGHTPFVIDLAAVPESAWRQANALDVLADRVDNERNLRTIQWLALLRINVYQPTDLGLTADGE